MTGERSAAETRKMENVSMLSLGSPELTGKEAVRNEESESVML